MVQAASIAGGDETGGVLIGRYSDDLTSAWVESVTTAPGDSASGPTWFIRGQRGLSEIFKKNWCDGLHYLGEWHSHPEHCPHPSPDDLRALSRIARSASFGCSRPVLAILGGSFDRGPLLSVSLGSSRGPAELLAPG
ncbi:Mov34/MPN/PAD-1 family protein [Paracoccus hibiscisoli]|uniref:Mov34/MPN/PAD-1 family protein n=1 Tax=Paracoccus hibiscisoli TaxID=2023261 RepID=UPI003C6EA05D